MSSVELPLFRPLPFLSNPHVQTVVGHFAGWVRDKLAALTSLVRLAKRKACDGVSAANAQQRGYPGKPLLEYTVDDIRREYRTAKGCAPRCTVACVHQVAYIDGWRDPQSMPPSPVGESVPERLVQLQ